MSVVGNIAGAALGFLGAKKGADAQGDAAKSANAMQRYMFDQTREDQAPFREGGRKANDELAFLLGLDANGLMTKPPGSKATPAERAAYQANVAARKADPRFGMLTRQFTGDDLVNDPGYQFGMDQGTNALESSAAARGGVYSGAAGRALAKFSQDYAGTKFNEAFNRDAVYKNQLLNPLQSMTGAGQSATNAVQNAGQNYANQVSGNAIGMGNARASSYIGQANALAGGINGALYNWNKSGGGMTGAPPQNWGQNWGLGNGPYGGSDDFYG